MPDEVNPAAAPKMLLPWYRESAFLAWIDKTGAAFAAALVALATDIADAREHWQIALLVPAMLSAADFLGSLRAIFLSGPVTYQDPPAPKPAALPDAAAVAELRARLEALEKKFPPTDPAS